MRFLSYILLSATVAYASPVAQPTDALEERTLKCKDIKGALKVLKILGPPATKFCSSYLHIPATVTQTATAVPSVVTVTTSTQTITTTSSICPGIAIRGIARAVDELHNTLAKRNVNVPALSAFAKDELSCGCSCLQLTPKTTVTTTFTPPPTSTVNVVATSTACVTPPACAPDFAPCTFDRPDLCCGLTCIIGSAVGLPDDSPVCIGAS